MSSSMDRRKANGASGKAPRTDWLPSRMNSSSPAMALAARKICSTSVRFILSENRLTFARREDATKGTGLAKTTRFFGAAFQQGHKFRDSGGLHNSFPFQDCLPIAFGVIGICQPTSGIGQSDLNQLWVGTNFLRDDAIHFEASVIQKLVPGLVAVDRKSTRLNSS